MDLLSNPIVTQFIGLFVGIGSSLLSWWILVHGLAPKVEFSPNISKLPDSNKDDRDHSNFKYRFKMQNVGKRRVCDVEVRARLKIRGLDMARPGWSEIVIIPLQKDGSREYYLPFLSPVHKTSRSTSLRLYVNCTSAFEEPFFPDHIRSKAAARTLVLDDLLNLGTEAILTIHLSGVDEFSGAKRYFQVSYTASSIVQGQFKGLEIEPNSVSKQVSIERQLERNE